MDDSPKLLGTGDGKQSWLKWSNCNKDKWVNNSVHVDWLGEIGLISHCTQEARPRNQMGRSNCDTKGNLEWNCGIIIIVTISKADPKLYLLIKYIY